MAAPAPIAMSPQEAARVLKSLMCTEWPGEDNITEEMTRAFCILMPPAGEMSRSDKLTELHLLHTFITNPLSALDGSGPSDALLPYVVRFIEQNRPFVRAAADAPAAAAHVAASINAMLAFECAASRGLVDLVCLPELPEDSITDIQLATFKTVIPGLSRATRRVQCRMLTALRTFVRNPGMLYADTGLSGEIQPFVSRFLSGNMESISLRLRPAVADAVNHALLQTIFLRHLEEEEVTDAQISVLLSMFPGFMRCTRAVQARALVDLRKYTIDNEARYNESGLPEWAREQVGDFINANHQEILDHIRAGPPVAPGAPMEIVPDAVVMDAIEAGFRKCHEVARAIMWEHRGARDAPSKDARTRAINDAIAAHFHTVHERMRFLRIMMEAVPEWIEFNAHICKWFQGGVANVEFTMALATWRRTRVTPPTRDEILQLIHWVENKDRRAAVLCVLMGMVDAQGNPIPIKNREPCYLLFDWPCAADVNWIYNVASLLKDEHVATFVGQLMREYVPVQKRAVTLRQIEQHFVPIVARVSSRTYRYLLSGAMIDTLHHVTDAMHRAFEQVVLEGDPNGCIDQVHVRLAQLVQMHNHAFESASNRALVSAMKPIVPAAAIVDEELPTEETNAVTHERAVKSELAVLACVMCYKNKIRVSFQPCGHAMSCHACYLKLPQPKLCPNCRVPIADMHGVFL